MPGCYPTNTMFGCIIDNLGTGLGIGYDAAAFLVGGVLCIIIIIALYRVTGSGLSLPIGAFLGLGFTIGAGIIPNWVFMTIVFLLIMAVAFMLFGEKGGED